MDPRTTEKLAQLRDYYWDNDDSLRYIDTIEKRLRAVIAKEKLKDNTAVVQIIADAASRVHVINASLQTDEKLTDSQRQALFVERRVHTFWLNRFDPSIIEKNYQAIDDMLDKELDRIK